MEVDQEQAQQQTKVAITSFRDELLEGNFDDAKVIEREGNMPPQAVKSIINFVFEQFILQERFLEAIELGKRYDLSKDKINDTIYLEFRRLINVDEIESAINWAMSKSLPDYEITRAAVKGIENAIYKQDIERAIDLKKKYSVTEEQIGDSWQPGYEMAFQTGRYFEAALLSREFGMSDRKTVLTAAKALRVALVKADFEKLSQIEQEFRLFNDTAFSLLSDEDGRSLIKATEDFLKEKLRSDNFRNAVQVIGDFGIIYKKIANHILRDLVHFVYTNSVQVHQSLLDENRYDDALWLKEELNLLEENTPDKTLREVYMQGMHYHNKVLKNGNISAAIKVKKDYEILGELSNAETVDQVQSAVLGVLGELIDKGNTKAGNQLIKEYNIPQEEVQQVAKDVVVRTLESGDFERAVEIVSKFHIDPDDFEIKAAAKGAFDKSFKSGYFETAANIGHIFHIEGAEVKQAAAKIWEDLMQRQDYKKASIVRKKHKLSKKSTEKLAKAEYDRLVAAGESDLAKQVRNDYKINISFINLIIDFFRKLFALFFGGGSGSDATSEVNQPAQQPPEQSTESPNANI